MIATADGLGLIDGSDALSAACLAWARLPDDEREPRGERCAACGVNESLPGDDVCGPCRRDSDDASRGDS